jgi:two-component system, chemotaxis family, sensor kinase CheA
MESEVSGLAMAREIVEQLTHGIIAGPDDLAGIGECLNLIEKLEADAVPLPQASVHAINRLKELFRLVILEHCSDLERDWGEIQRLIGSLGGQPVEEPFTSDFGPALPVLQEIAAPPQVTEDDGRVDEPEDPAEFHDPELLKDFIEEAKEGLAGIELNMIELEANPDDLGVINDVFRPFHSIKGVAGFLNLKQIHELSHEVENYLDQARSGKLQITNTAIDVVLVAVDMLKSLLLDLEKPPGRTPEVSTPKIKALLQRIKRIQQGEIDIESGVPIRKLGEILVDSGVIESEVMEEIIEQSRSSGSKLGEQLIKKGLMEPRDVGSALREQRQLRENAAVVRIDTQKLDNLVDMVGELVIAQSMVLNNPCIEMIKDQKLQKDSAQLRRIASELQRISMSMRMVPIKSTFQKMIRLVRDLSKKSGKEVHLDMKGEDTEIDRNMVEEIYEPLVHMIRNALDHGIEMPEDRIRVGKNPRGTIILSAQQKGGNIVIEIQDDGSGLDAPKIKAKAVKVGLIAATDNLEDGALFELIFQPGFSTKEVVTEISGRGVGMDVVKESIDRLRGKIEIASTPGRGSSFHFKLPLTMAIIDGMVIRIGGERYIVPTVAINESLRPPKESYVTVQGRGEVLNVRNQLMPLVRLHEIFGVEPRCYNPWDALVLVVGENNRPYCLLVDEIIGRQEVVIKTLGDSMRHVVGISGGAILGDGKVALIVDVKGVVSLHEGCRK